MKKTAFAFMLMSVLTLSFQNCGTGGQSAASSTVTPSAATFDASNLNSEITSMYETVFGRAPTAAELATWDAELNSGAASISSFRATLASSAEAQAEISKLLTAAGVSSTSATGILLTAALTSALGSGTSFANLSTYLVTLLKTT